MANFTNNGTGTFVGDCSAATRTLLVGEGWLGDYLQAKMAKLLGKKRDEVLIGTPLTIKSKYGNDEGVIDAMKKKDGFVKGLRIDLQKAQTVGPNTYAAFQIQWGTGMDGRNGGAYAGALVRVETLFSVGDLGQALSKSLDTRTYWRIDP